MNPLFGFELFEITPIGAWAVAATAVACWFAGKALFKDDRELRELQREADDLSIELSKLGFTLLPPILRDLAFLDIIQTKSDVKHAVDVLKDPAKRRLDFAKLLEGLLKEEAKNTDTRQGFLNGVVAMFKIAGVVPTTDTPGTDAVGNKLDPASFVDRSLFQARPAPVTVNVHTNGTSASTDTGSAAAPAGAVAKAA